MDWNGNLRTFVSRPDHQPSINFLYNYDYDQFPGMEMKHPAAMAETQHGLVLPGAACYGNQEKKKRLTNDQLESLERSFQEEIKLDPDRKMKLSRELGLQPRQIAVWFQNRRARWKAKQIEHLYDALKQEFDVISREKQKLQEEVATTLFSSPCSWTEGEWRKERGVMKLKAILREQVIKKQVSNTAGYTEISGEETVESTSVAIRSSGKPQGGNQHQMAECNHLFNIDEYNPVSSPYWAALPSYPLQ